MKKLATILLVLIIAINKSYSQGFDWQYSARLPFSVPSFFVGISSEYNYLKHNCSLDFLEGKTYCETYDEGSGNGFSVGLYSELWTKSGLLAYYGGLQYAFAPGNFSVQAVPIPLPNGDLYITQYEFNSKSHYVLLEFGAKYRLFESHFHVSGGVQIGLLISSSGEHLERILSPDYAQFSTIPPTTSRILSNVTITEADKFIISPKIKFGYDLNLGLGMYATPSFSLSYSVIDLSGNSDWKRWNFAFGLTILHGIQ